uniref:Major facilitator superfamily domain-containing protein 8 n=1 Tax=Hydra vulgaris TaxID=6087 RepID=T2M975_HYDVU
MEDNSDKRALVINRKESQQTLNTEFEIKKKKIIFTLYFIMFTGSVGFSILMSSMWPFMKEIDKSVSETFYGWVNAAFSFAQMLFSFMFGYWCDRRSSKEPLMVSFILMISGYIIYAYAQTKGGLWFVLVGRILVGCSAGNVAVTRTLGAHLTNHQERAKVLSYLTMSQATGFLIGPLFQAASNPVGSKVYNISFIRLKLSMYTIPCLIMIVLGVVNIILVLVYIQKISNESEAHEKANLTSNFEPVDKYAVLACIGLWFVGMSIFSLNESILSPLLMNEYGWSREQTTLYGAIILSCSGVQSIFLYIAAAPLCKSKNQQFLFDISSAIKSETSIPEIVATLQPCKMAMDCMSGNDSNLNIAEGALKFLLEELRTKECFICGYLIVIEEIEIEILKRHPVLTVLKFLNNPGVLEETKLKYPTRQKKKSNVRQQIQVTDPNDLTAEDFVSYVMTGFKSEKFTERKVMIFSYFLMFLGFVFYLPWGPGKLKIIDNINATTIDNGGGGCPSNYRWCHYTPQLSFPQLVTGIIFINTGYPLGIVMVNVLYSKIIGPFQQGRYMAWLTGIGSLARVAGPLYITAIYKHFGLRWSATSTIIIIFATIVTIGLSWRRLVPYAPGRKIIAC